jgi:hypothetical protein
VVAGDNSAGGLAVNRHVPGSVGRVQEPDRTVSGTPATFPWPACPVRN